MKQINQRKAILLLFLLAMVQMLQGQEELILVSGTIRSGIAGSCHWRAYPGKEYAEWCHIGYGGSI